MKNTKNRLTIFNDFAFEMYNELKLKVRDIHLSEFALSITASYYHTKQNDFRLYNVRVYENYFEIRCTKGYLSKTSKKYFISKKF